MKTIFIDCGMGAAGDMLAAALLELHPDRDGFVRRFHEAGIPEVELCVETSVSCGVTGTRVRMLVHGEEEHAEDVHGHEHGHEHGHGHHHEDGHHHHHASMRDIDALIDGLHLDGAVKEDIRAVYRLIADAESAVHGVPVTDIHFHEVGTMDAVADITAVCMLLHELAPDEVVATPVATGYGSVKCAHGILPVPAPATALLLKEIPAYAGDCEGELCTPTGAALLKHFATRFAQMPLMRVQKTGYGMGSKQFSRMNAVRMIIGEADDPGDRVTEFFFNVDDMTGEDAGFATERIFAAGALEVYTTPVFMKKNRPGLLFSVMCREAEKKAVLQAVFRHTTTIGVRETQTERHVLVREETERKTPYGTVREKKVSGHGVSRTKTEYEDLAHIARERGLSLEEVRALLRENQNTGRTV